MKHVGSDFDEFLAEEGLLEEVEAVATKRVLAYQISEAMKDQQLSKAAMARRMGWVLAGPPWIGSSIRRSRR